MFELIHGGSFSLTVYSLNGMDCFAASMIMLETLSAISSTLFAADIKLQLFSLRNMMKVLSLVKTIFYSNIKYNKIQQIHHIYSTIHL